MLDAPLNHQNLHNRAIKYIIRHRDKGKKQDLLKAIHFIEMIIERDYGTE